MMRSEKIAIALTFWDHLEELRHVLLRCISVIALFAILAFVFKDEVFAIITPTSDAFTLAIVSAPMYLLYEVSILLVPRSQCR